MFGKLGVGAYKQRMPQREDALPGRAAEMPLRNRHHVHGRPLRDVFEGLAHVQFGMGCFWGAERKFWSLSGVVTTAAGYAGGYTPNATYGEVCSGRTGHAEVVLVVYDLIPLRHPAFCAPLFSHVFGRWLPRMLACSDAVACISGATEQDLRAWCAQQGVALPPAAHFRLGSELPQGGETVIEFPNNHLGYAITWFGFAILTPILLAFWISRQRKGRG